MTTPFSSQTAYRTADSVATIHEAVRARYADAAVKATTTDCCSGDCCADDAQVFGPALYSALEREELP